MLNKIVYSCNNIQKHNKIKSIFLNQQSKLKSGSIYSMPIFEHK